MTFAVLASNADTQEIGIALTTVTINAGRITPFHHGLLPSWNERGLVVTPQATVNPHNAHKMFELWDQGQSFAEIELELSRFDKHWIWRQVGAVTAAGEVYAYTGADAWTHASHIAGEGSLALGNFMDGPGPVEAMAAALEAGRELPMDQRLMQALEAGRDAGGQADPEAGHVPELFAMIQVFNGRQPWPAVDLRVDFDLDAVSKLRRLLTQTKRLDPVFQAMHENPGATFDEYQVVFEILNSQV